MKKIEEKRRSIKWKSEGANVEKMYIFMWPICTEKERA